jgi:hypothetical protein
MKFNIGSPKTLEIKSMVDEDVKFIIPELPKDAQGSELDAMDVDDNDDLHCTMAVPRKHIPMANLINMNHFYVRPCYPYYNKWMLQLLNRDIKYIVTLTGTPGIGKSVFYIYVATRFAQAYPDWEVVATSCSTSGTAEMCRLLKWDTETLSVTYTPCDYPPDPRFPDGEKRLYLYDGAPFATKLGGLSVAFSSPNDQWFNSIRKSESKCTMFMPTWSWSELEDAFDKLKLNSVMSKDELERRFDAFGGCPRQSFTHHLSYARFQEELKLAFSKINSWKTVEDLTSDARIFYLEPNHLN